VSSGVPIAATDGASLALACLQRGANIREEPLGVNPTALHELPFIDSFRTLCVDPTPEMKAVFEGIQRLAVAG
jgi:hypothetical protein